MNVPLAVAEPLAIDDATDDDDGGDAVAAVIYSKALNSNCSFRQRIYSYSLVLHSPTNPNVIDDDFDDDVTAVVVVVSSFFGQQLALLR